MTPENSGLGEHWKSYLCEKKHLNPEWHYGVYDLNPP
jgi:hypothetical protein